MLFFRDSKTGAVRAVSRSGRGIELNTVLHNAN
jgi:hypothetical protein